MPASSINFGYLPEALELRVGKVEITTLPDLEGTVHAIKSQFSVDGAWLYSPLQTVHNLGGTTRTAPYPARVFGLPKTHSFAHDDGATPEHVAFHLWSLSFFQGMRLTQLAAGFLDATPIETEKLHDFILYNDGIEHSIALAEAFWNAHQGTKATSLFGSAVHSLFLAQYPKALEFERFVYYYTSLDACFALAKELHGLTSRTHGERIGEMCDFFGIPKPDWADAKASSANALVATIRNATLHEAIFMDQPLGFATTKAGIELNLTLQMQALVCRLLVALIGARGADYVRTPINTRQRHMLRL